MEQIINYCVENKETIWTAIASLVVVANAVARLTPTQKDNNWIARVQVLMDKLGNLFLPDIQCTKSKTKKKK